MVGYWYLYYVVLCSLVPRRLTPLSWKRGIGILVTWKFLWSNRSNLFQYTSNILWKYRILQGQVASRGTPTAWMVKVFGFLVLVCVHQIRCFQMLFSIHWIQLHVKLIWSNEFDLICLRQWLWTWTKRHITASQSITCHSTTSVDAVLFLCRFYILLS